MKKRYISFNKLPDEEGKKTSIWQVISIKHGNILGEIRWFSVWRQYCFFPKYLTVFNSDCLEVIYKFLVACNDEYKKKWKN